MSFDAMLNHRCDVYHMARSDASPGYGLPASPVFSYPDEPDIAGLACHFNVKAGQIAGLHISQGEPMATLDGGIKLAAPLGADLRINDKIVDAHTGLEYTAGAPIRIRDHHQVVVLRRTAEQRPL